jgi:F0F1-type ATP synthase membrane subunit c/vacuolar-type H+-ATPase subunit K
MKTKRQNRPLLFWAYVLVAAAAFLAGLWLGGIGSGLREGQSRVNWPRVYP